MPKCDTTVTTPTGVFTYFSEEVSYCQAKYNCAEIGQILAPITKLSDKEALQSVADIYNPDCDFHSDIYSYHIGLDISICGGKQYRLILCGTKLSMEVCTTGGMEVKRKIQATFKTF